MVLTWAVLSGLESASMLIKNLRSELKSLFIFGYVCSPGISSLAGSTGLGLAVGTDDVPQKIRSEQKRNLRMRFGIPAHRLGAVQVRLLSLCHCFPDF